jgi:hypothetical protein
MAKKVKEAKIEARLPRFKFIEGVAYWQVPSNAHLELLKAAAEQFKWEIEDQGVVKATGLNRWRIKHTWLREQFAAEQLDAWLDRQKQETEAAERKTCMYSLPHLVFKDNVCSFVPQSEEQKKGIAYKSERLGWNYDVLPDGTYVINKRAKAA